MKNKNIILITVDTLRYDHSKIIKDKMIEVLGKGIEFVNAYSTGPSSGMSYIGFLSSKYPSFPDEKDSILTPDINRKRTLLYEILKNNGYKTYVISNTNFYIHYGYDKGMDVMIYKENISGIKKLKRKLAKKPLDNIINKLSKLLNKIIRLVGKEKIKTPFLPYYDAKEMIEIVREILKLEKNKNKIFIHINYMDPHTPVNISNDYIQNNMTKEELKNIGLGFKDIIEMREIIDKKSQNKNMEQEINNRLETYEKFYNYEILYTADNISKLLEYFKKADKLNDTIIIFHSDHGEYIRPEGNLFGHGHGAKNKKETLNVFYNNLVHVPLVFWGLGQKNMDNVDKVVSLVDLSPTILEIIGIKKPLEWYGESFFSNNDKPVILEDVRYGNNNFCVRTNDWAFAYNKDNGHEYLFKNSPEDKHDLSSKRRDVVEQMYGLLEIHNRKIEACWREYIKKDIKDIMKNLNYK